MTRSGDRADDVARALLLTIAAGMRTLTGDPLGHVVITSADLRHLLGITSPGPRTVELPGTLRVVDDLDAALDDLEVALAHRAPAAGPHDPVEAAVVLIATAPRPGTPTARMQRLLEAGHPHRVCAVLLGDWPTPTRVAVGEDATAAQITGPLPADLSGARLFTVPRHDALDLLTTLARPSDPAQPLDPSPRGVEPAAETTVGPEVERAGDDSADDSAVDAAHDPATPAAAAASGAMAPDGVGRDPAEGGDSTGARCRSPGRAACRAGAVAAGLRPAEPAL